MKILLFFISTAIIAFSNSCSNAPGSDKSDEKLYPSEVKAKNVILMIGDGMGISQVSSTYYYGDEEPVFNSFKNIGLVQTSSAKEKITGSAAAGTAIASGVKTKNTVLGLDTNFNNLKNITEIISKKKNIFTGLVATSSITHATPAAFYAHVESRKMHDEIALQLINSQIDFFAGGGKDFFFKRKDNQNLYKSLVDAGFLIDTISIEKETKFDISKKYGYLLADNEMPPIIENRGDFLRVATNKAIEYLSLSEDGFFLMVEGSQIDWGGHAMHAKYTIDETLDFQKAVKAALEFAKRDGNTLLIVTADHETGGFSLSSNEGNYNDIKPNFATDGHTASLVPLFAYGPGSEDFSGVYDNTDIFKKIIKYFGLE
jgi:alkaline phosphatase